MKYILTGNHSDRPYMAFAILNVHEFITSKIFIFVVMIDVNILFKLTSL